MTIRPIRVLGDPVLRTPCDEVTSFGDELQSLIDDLEDTVREPGRAGLAAPQIGVSLRAFSYNLDGAVGHVINPVLSDLEGEEIDDEGCLSIPGLYFMTTRSASATVRGLDREQKPVLIEATGYLARAMQHETDHLAGTLYVDTLKGDVRRQALREMRRTRSL
jgi:peptide deformylase